MSQIYYKGFFKETNEYVFSSGGKVFCTSVQNCTEHGLNQLEVLQLPMVPLLHKKVVSSQESFEEEIENIVPIETVEEKSNSNRQQVDTEQNEHVDIVENEKDRVNKKIWLPHVVNKNQQAVDREATTFFLSLVKDNYTQLNDDITKKYLVWDKIAKQMEEKGYDLGKESVREKGNKCCQKWRNLLKAYKGFVGKHTTGSGADVWGSQPDFFEEIQEIMGEVHSAHPPYVTQSSLKKQDPRMFSQSRFNKLRKQVAGKNSDSSDGQKDTDLSDSGRDSESRIGKETDDSFLLDDDDLFGLPSSEATEGTSGGRKRPPPKRRNGHEGKQSYLQKMSDILQKQSARMDLDRKEREVKDKQKEESKEKRHSEKIEVAKSMVDAIKELATAVAKRPRVSYD